MGDQTTTKEHTSMYVVGIGASAGGLEALQDFFQAMPADTGAAFVVIQHLSPDYKSLMSELLARYTTMPVMTAEEKQRVEPDHVYLIPPRKNLSISDGKLYLKEQPAVKGVNLAIDTFFRSLATAGKNTVAIVLSGAGSDGTLGIRDVKEAGGMIMVQDPQTAKFNSMPNNAIATGLADYVLPPDQMGEALAGYIKHPFINKEAQISLEESENENALSKILSVMKEYARIDFSLYKDNTIIRRLERRVSINRCNSLEEYLPLFLESDKEKNTLYKEFLIGVTSFFRDREAFEAISKSVLPHIQPHNKQARIWSVACSTGEEVYSLAMLLLQHVKNHDLDYDIKIFATDIDREALNIASQGFYPDSVVSDIDPLLLSRYFSKCDGGWKAGTELRKMIIFSVHNVLQDPPFSKLDLLVCRNMFIYLKPQAQQELLSTFYYALNPGGFLFMGTSESTGDMSDAFQVISRRWKIYRQREGYKPLFRGAGGITGFQGGASYHLNKTLTPDRNSNRMEKIIQQAFAATSPPSVIIDDNDNIVHMENDVNGILVFHAGTFSQNLFCNLPNSLSLFANGVLRKLKNGALTSTTARATGLPEYINQDVIITGYALNVQNARYYLLSFRIQETGQNLKEHITPYLDNKSELNKYIKDLEQELQLNKENLQATVEELETSNEELQSSNEELVASNEELQSTNEELQSVNEELYTVNSEYQLKIDELLRLNNDLDNMLTNTQIGALYLDNKLHIRKVTPVICKVTNIRESDVGRPISHIELMEAYPNWKKDIQHVKSTLHSIDKEIHTSAGHYWMVRIRPYRTEFNSVEGIIMTFVESTNLRKIHRHVDGIVDRLNMRPSSRSTVAWRYDTQTCKVSIENNGGKKDTQIPISEEEFFDRVHPDDRLHVRSALDECVNVERSSCEITLRLKNPQGAYVWHYIYLTVMERDVQGKPLVLCGLSSRLEDLELPKEILDSVRESGNILSAKEPGEK